MNRRIYDNELVDFDDIALATFMPYDPDEADSEDRLIITLKISGNEYTYDDEVARRIWADLKALKHMEK